MTTADTNAPRSDTLKAAVEWGILISGALSLAFAILATTTGIVSADETNHAVAEIVSADQSVSRPTGFVHSR